MNKKHYQYVSKYAKFLENPYRRLYKPTLKYNYRARGWFKSSTDHDLWDTYTYLLGRYNNPTKAFYEACRRFS